MKQKYIKCVAKDPARLNKVGGQAVLEGVMMKAGNRVTTSVRTESGVIVVKDSSFVSVRKKHKILNIPILRGVINFVEMMALSVKTLNASAEALGIEEEDSKTQKWLKKHLGIGLTDLIMLIGTVLGIMLSLLLFMYLPNLLSALSDKYIFGGKLGAWGAVLEGFIKILIFILYLYLVSLIPDIKRTFMYHGAEHKSIACFEAGAELTPESAKNYTRYHPRCGTSFMFFMILLGIFAGFFVKILIPGLGTLAYTGIRLLILPIVMGIGYEVIMLAGKKDNILTRTISRPGLWVQRITTKEPTPDMLEVAITSIKCALRDDFPEFMEFYRQRGWEKQKESDTDAEQNTNGDGTASGSEKECEASEGIADTAANEKTADTAATETITDTAASDIRADARTFDGVQSNNGENADTENGALRRSEESRATSDGSDLNGETPKTGNTANGENRDGMQDGTAESKGGAV